MYTQFHNTFLPTTTHFTTTKTQNCWKKFAHQQRFTDSNYFNKIHAAPSVDQSRHSISEPYIECHWTVRGLNPGGGEIFRTRPYRPWGPPSLLYNGYCFSFPGVKRPGRGIDHPPPSSAEVKERVELYLYSSSVPSWPILG